MPDCEVAVLGAGAWGTALALILSRNGRKTALCARRVAQADSLRERRENTIYLPGVPLPQSLEIAADVARAIAVAETVVMAVPSRFARAVFSPLAPALKPDAIVVSAIKGIEETGLKRMTSMVREVAPPGVRTAVLSGPGFAAELARGKPGALVCASDDDQTARHVQELFAGRSLRVYRSTDVVGVELAGAVKNVIAIAAGISDGLDLGSSARAALITRGLAEMSRLGLAMGARAGTMAGLAGLGDLVLTCTGALSRNHSLGLALGRGERAPALARAGAEDRPVAEGVANARAVLNLANRHGVEMPIVHAVYRCLYEDQPPNAMVEELLSRQLKAEF